jgi:RsiW-degrading membrane proteinase PrsW (M82 family)
MKRAGPPTSEPSRQALLLCDSPLKTPQGALAFALIMALAPGLAIHTWIGWLTPLGSAWVLLFALGMSVLGSVLALFAIRFLDRRDPEPWPLRIGAVAVAVLVAPGAAAFFNERSPFPTLTVGFNEEVWKVFPLLLVAVFLPRWILGMRDGLVYGAIGGLGFNIMETAVYVLRTSFPKDGLLLGTSEQLGRLGWWGIGNHMLWAALTGAGIGYFIQHPRARWRIVLPIAFYLLAVLTHTAQDNGVSIVLFMLFAALLSALGAGLTAQPGTAAAQQELARYTPTLLAFEVVAINLINLPLLAWAVLRSGRWEREAIRTQLADEAAQVVTPAEYQAVLAEGRFRLRRVAGYPGPVARSIRDAQNALALQKQYLASRGLALDGDPLVEHYRKELGRLRRGA